jgi:hypothetical protein
VPAFYGFRYNVVSLVAFGIGLIYPVNDNLIRNVIKIIAISAIASLLYGALQAHWLGPDILLSAGYPPDENGIRPLISSFYIGGEQIQRVNAGFSGPLAFSFYMYFVFTVFFSINYKSVLFVFVRGVSVLGLVLAFSRSFLVAAAFFYLIQQKLTGVRLIIFFVLMVFALLVFIILGENFDTPYINMAYDHFKNTLTLKDRSMIGHWESYLESLMLLRNHWLEGVGLGHVGPHAKSYIDEPYVPESTYLAIWLEGGVLVLLGLCIMFLLVFYKNRYNFISKFLVGLLLVMLLLPLQYYTEVTMQIALFMGLYINYIELSRIKYSKVKE